MTSPPKYRIASLQRNSSRKAQFPSLVEEWPSPQWVAKDAYDSCKICATNFRKAHPHHCRLCGEMICPRCSRKLPIPDKFKRKGKVGPARVCLNCEARAYRQGEARESRDKGRISSDSLDASDHQWSIVGLTGDIEVPVWDELDAYPNCKLCAKDFAKKDRFNCGLCGRVYCSSCTFKRELGEKFNLKKKSGPGRVCKTCEEKCRRKGEEIERKRILSDDQANKSQLLWQKLGKDIRGVREVPPIEIERYIGPKFVLDHANYKNLRKREDFSNKQKIQEGMLQHSDQDLPKSLTMGGEKKESAKHLGKKALQLFKGLQIFMGDRKPEERGASGSGSMMMPKSDLIDILTSGFRDHTDFLRDEIYVQIMKQLTNNPNPASMPLGWEVLGLCTEVFSPSDELRPFLIHFINANEAIFPQHRNDLLYAMRNIEENRIFTESQLAPDLKFVSEYKERVDARATICITFPDGSEIVFEVDRHPPDGPVTVKVLLPHIFELIGLKRTQGVALFEVSQYKERELHPDDIVLDKKAATCRDDSWRFLVKQSMYFTHELPSDPVAVSMIYHQAVVDLCEGNYSVSREELIEFLAAHKMLMARVKEIFPKPIGQINRIRMQSVRNKTFRQSDSWSELAKKKFIKDVTKAQIEYPKTGKVPSLQDQLAIVTKNYTFGAHFYQVKNTTYCSFPSSVVMSINLRGIFLLEPKTKRILKHFPFGHIQGWARTSEKFCFRALMPTKDVVVQFEFLTDQSQEILIILEAYHNHILQDPANNSILAFLQSTVSPLTKSTTPIDIKTPSMRQYASDGDTSDDETPTPPSPSIMHVPFSISLPVPSTPPTSTPPSPFPPTSSPSTSHRTLRYSTDSVKSTTTATSTPIRTSSSTRTSGTTSSLRTSLTTTTTTTTSPPPPPPPPPPESDLPPSSEPEFPRPPSSPSSPKSPIPPPPSSTPPSSPLTPPPPPPPPLSSLLSRPGSTDTSIHQDGPITPTAPSTPSTPTLLSDSEEDDDEEAPDVPTPKNNPPARASPNRNFLSGLRSLTSIKRPPPLPIPKSPSGPVGSTPVILSPPSTTINPIATSPKPPPIPASYKPRVVPKPA